MLFSWKKNYLYFIAPISIGIFAALPSSSQVGITEFNTNQGTMRNFSYNIKSTIGTQTSAEAVGNIQATTEAIINLKPGSIITNKFGDLNGNASANFVATPNGGNVDLKGITGENIFEFDKGTMFRSTLQTNTDLTPSSTNKGSASSFAIQDTMVNVQSGFSSFSNSFQQSF